MQHCIINNFTSSIDCSKQDPNGMKKSTDTVHNLSVYLSLKSMKSVRTIKSECTVKYENIKMIINKFHYESCRIQSNLLESSTLFLVNHTVLPT